MQTRRFAVLSLAAMAVPCLGAKSAPTIPRQEVVLTFKAGDRVARPIPLKDWAGRPMLGLELNPEMDGGGAVVGVDLGMGRWPKGGDNLLEPRQRYWHGYQGFMFMAWDYARGPDASIYGRTRRLSGVRTRLPVSITVDQVAVHPLSGPGHLSHALDSITLRVAVGPGMP